MRTKNELYQEALRTVAARRQMARARAEDARAEAEAAVPALRHAEDPEPLIAIGRVRGLLTKERLGTAGFGIDPIFYIAEHGQTFAQMPPALKNQLSHRGRAATQMRQLIADNWLIEQA